MLFVFAQSGISQSNSKSGAVLISTVQNETTLYCPSGDVKKKLLESNAEYRQKYLDFEKQYIQSMRTKVLNNPEIAGFRTTSEAVYTFPIIVHIINSGEAVGTPNNLSDAIIMSVINGANVRFSHQSGLKFPNNPYSGTDCGIQLCFAQRKSNNTFTTGIERYNNPSQANPTTFKGMITYMNSIKWDVTKYTNLFIITTSPTDFPFAGVYTGFPDDNVVFVSTIFNEGLVNHEVGHYFILDHTFEGGCKNDNCLTDGDKVCDTPPKSAPGYDTRIYSCINPSNSCTTDADDISINNPFRPVLKGGIGDRLDALENYMDYTGNCWAAFTQGQKLRMRSWIETYRQSNITNNFACNSNSGCPIITMTSLSAAYCQSAAAVTLTGSPAGGTFMLDGKSVTQIMPSALTAGSHTLIYSYLDANSCSGTTTQKLTINAAAVPTITALAAAYCQSSPAVTLTGNPSGGYFTIDTKYVTQFNPAMLSAGNHAVVYGYQYSNSCVNSVTQTVNVSANLMPSIPGLATAYCQNATAFNLVGSPAGGTFMLDGKAATQVAPSTLTTGSHTLVYNYTDANSCSGSTTQTFIVNKNPVPTINGLFAAYCSNFSAITLAGNPVGGTFTIDTKVGTQFVPATLGTGVHTVVYNYTDANSCSATATQSVTVNPIPTPTITGLATTYCQNDPITTLTGNPTGGGFTIDGLITTKLSPSNLSIGTHTVIYGYTDANACTGSGTQNFTVNAVPSVQFMQTLTKTKASFTNTSIGGATFLWSFGDPLKSTSTDQNPVFTYPSDGNYTVKLLVTTAGGCKDSLTKTVNILTGVDDIANELKVRVSPNPFSNFIQIKFDAVQVFSPSDDLWITNAVGQAVYRQKLSTSDISVNSKDWSNGIYFLNAQIGIKRVCFAKIVKLE